MDTARDDENRRCFWRTLREKSQKKLAWFLSGPAWFLSAAAATATGCAPLRRRPAARANFSAEADFWAADFFLKDLSSFAQSRRKLAFPTARPIFRQMPANFPARLSLGGRFWPANFPGQFFGPIFSWVVSKQKLMFPVVLEKSASPKKIGRGNWPATFKKLAGPRGKANFRRL